MRFSLYLLSLFSLQASAIWPVPQSLTSGHSVVWIDRNIEVTYNGAHVDSILHFATGSYTEQIFVQQQQSSYSPRDEASLSSHNIVQQAVSRALETLFNQSPIPWKLFPRNELGNFEPAENQRKTYVSRLTITQTAKDDSNTFKPLAGQVDESYTVTLTEDGKATVVAVSYLGVLHGLQTFIQLFYQHSNGCIYSNMAPVLLKDAPKFQHRGLNLDVSRNWYPVSNILRTIDALSWNKFNRLHIHMTDSQSWPMDIPSLPLLSQRGAYSRGLSYTPEDITQIQTFGIIHGVEVIIEIDMPGHTSSIGLAFPELIAAFGAQQWDQYCAEPPCGSLMLNNPAVPEFLQKLFDDVLPRVSPFSAYFHTGGDEVNMNTYLLDPTVRSNDRAVLQPLIQKFVDRNHDQIRKAGLTPIVWEEMLLDWGLNLGDDVVVQSWLSDESVGQITTRGHKALAGNYNYWYLDCGKGQWLNFDNGNSFQHFYPFNDYCSPYHNWRLVYSYDPLAGVAPQNQHLVLGGEVHIWSEQTDPVNLDDMVWPRTCAAGEVLWSGRQDADGKNRSQITAAPRLVEMRERMVNRGIRAGPVQMVFCTQNNATECAL